MPIDDGWSKILRSNYLFKIKRMSFSDLMSEIRMLKNLLKLDLNVEEERKRHKSDTCYRISCINKYLQERLQSL